jgi:hypothetical protein
MNGLHCPEQSLANVEEEIARVQDTLKIKQTEAIYRQLLI